MAILADPFIGDDEDAREFASEDDAVIYGRCPDCGIEHGGGFCPEPQVDLNINDAVVIFGPVDNHDRL